MKLIRFLLFPFAVLYDVITRIRNFLFDKNIFKSTSFNIPVIAVGNLSVGGTGKTPQIEYLIRLLQTSHKIAVLSRGYKRKTKGFLIADNTSSAEDIGDEPLQFFKKFKNITVAVDANRVNGIESLIKTKQPEIILLDDAYQHRKVKAGYYILLTKYKDLYADDFLLPTGHLRESKLGAKRANTVIVTKCPENLSEEEQINIREKLKLTNNQLLFFTTIAYNNNIQGKKALTINDLSNKEILLITGIAKPTSLLLFLKDKKIKYTHLEYPDHHHFSIKDIQKIKASYKNISSENKLILTTEKDYVRLEKSIENLHYIEIKASFLNNENHFNSEIQRFVKR